MSTALTVPTEEVSEQARVAARSLAQVLKRSGSRTLRVAPPQGKELSITVPREAFVLFLEVLGQMANGNMVTIVPIHAEVTTQQAADLLNVSRPHVVKLLEEGVIAYRKVGAHRRVKMADLLAYKNKSDAESRADADELTREAEELGLGY